MSQADLVIADQPGADFLTELNQQLAALGSQSSGAVEPPSPRAYQVWADTANGVIKQRNAANNAWIVRGPLAETLTIARAADTALAIGDYGRNIIATGTFTQTFNAAATLGDGWAVRYRNNGTGVITLDPSGAETIDGASTISLAAGESCIIVSNGTALYTIGRPSQYANGGPGGTAFGFRNRLINGNFQVWQRGTSFTPSAATVTYTADRWFVYRAGTAAITVSQVASQVSGVGVYALKIQRNAGNATLDSIYAGQVIESVNCAGLAGKTVTLAFTAKAGANYSGGNLVADVLCGTGIDEGANGTLSGSWTGFNNAGQVSAALTTSSVKFSGQISIPAGTKEIALRFDRTVAGTAGADDSVTIEQVQLEEGSTVTPLEVRPYGLELSLCQRYYETGVEPLSWINNLTGQTAAYGSVPFAVTKRATATMTFSGWQYYSIGTPTNFTPTVSNVTADKFGFTGTGFTNWAGWAGAGVWSASAEL